MGSEKENLQTRPIRVKKGEGDPKKSVSAFRRQFENVGFIDELNVFERQKGDFEHILSFLLLLFVVPSTRR